jgi:hypothetical protein
VPISYRIDPSHGLLIYRFEGTVTDADYLSVFRAVSDEPALPRCRFHLSDQREVVRLELTAGGISRVASLIAQEWTNRLPPWRLAIVAPNDTAYGMGRMYQQVRGEGYERIAIFRDLDPASRWLLEEEPAQSPGSQAASPD